MSTIESAVTFQHELEQRVDRSLETYISFLQKVLRIPTPRMQEHECLRFVGDALDRINVPVTYFEGRGKGEAMPDGLPLNFHGVRTGSGGGRSLLLQAHMDTVPPGDETKWTSSPWSGEIRSGRIYGRGAHDDRTGAAILWMLADLLNQMNVVTKGDLTFLVTTEEEYSCGGMQAYVERLNKVVPDAHLAIDGNRTHHSILGHAGVLSFQIRLRGPWGSIFQRDLEHDANPIEHAAWLIQQLREFERRLQEYVKSLHPHPRWPEPKVVVTTINSSGWFSNIPEECRIGGIGNVIPPMSIGDFKAMLDAFLGELAAEMPAFRQSRPLIEWGPLEMDGYATEVSSEFFQSLSVFHRAYFQADLQPRYIGGWGDMRLVGSPNLVFYGPGGGGGDHNYDEYYELADLGPTLKTIGRLVGEWCGISEMDLRS